MAGPLNAKVIMARCSKNKKSFGIRIEQRGKDWVRTWAFPIDERKAKREKFDDNTVSGSMEPDGYPGCPHCGSQGFAQCVCKKISCDGGMSYSSYGIFGSRNEMICPWCEEKCVYQNANNVDVSGEGY